MTAGGHHNKSIGVGKAEYLRDLLRVSSSGGSYTFASLSMFQTDNSRKVSHAFFECDCCGNAH
jgi:hypothetical protein